MNAETEAADRKARLTPNKSVSTGALLRAYAELDAEREAHKATVDALDRLVNSVLDFCEWDNPQRKTAMLVAMQGGAEALRCARGVEASDAEA